MVGFGQFPGGMPTSPVVPRQPGYGPVVPTAPNAPVAPRQPVMGPFRPPLRPPIATRQPGIANRLRRPLRGRMVPLSGLRAL